MDVGVLEGLTGLRTLHLDIEYWRLGGSLSDLSIDSTPETAINLYNPFLNPSILNLKDFTFSFEDKDRYISATGELMYLPVEWKAEFEDYVHGKVMRSKSSSRRLIEA